MNLSQFILTRIDLILADWENFAKSIPAAATMARDALRDDAERILRTIAQDMQQHQNVGEQELKSRGKGFRALGVETGAELHSSNRLESGFNLDELVSEYRALRATVIRLWLREPAPPDDEALYDLTRFNEGIDQALTESIARYSAMRDRSRELFLGMVGHDLRTPLGVVIASAQMLLLDDLTETQANAVARILRSGARIKALVSDLVDAAHLQLGGLLPIELEKFDLASTCNDAVDEMLAFYPKSVIYFNKFGDLVGTWDAGRLRQVIANLLQNAIQYGDEGTPVTLSARGEQNGAVLTVHNEGPAIPESASQRIFEPLVRGEIRNQSGQSRSLGLGLYIAREIALAHGGSIVVQSSESSGTMFTVWLPRR